MIELAKVPLLEHRIKQARDDISDSLKNCKNKTDSEESGRKIEREKVVTNNKDGGYTLTPKEKNELERQINDGGSRSIRIENAGILINAAGEEITGVSTAYTDIHCFNAAVAVKKHIAEALSPMCGEESVLQVPHLTALKLTTLRLDNGSWCLSHFGNVLYKDTTANQAKCSSRGLSRIKLFGLLSW